MVQAHERRRWIRGNLHQVYLVVRPTEVREHSRLCKRVRAKIEMY